MPPRHASAAVFDECAYVLNPPSGDAAAQLNGFRKAAVFDACPPSGTSDGDWSAGSEDRREPQKARLRQLMIECARLVAGSYARIGHYMPFTPRDEPATQTTFDSDCIAGLGLVPLLLERGFQPTSRIDPARGCAALLFSPAPVREARREIVSIRLHKSYCIRLSRQGRPPVILKRFEFSTVRINALRGFPQSGIISGKRQRQRVLQRCGRFGRAWLPKKRSRILPHCQSGPDLADPRSLAQRVQIIGPIGHQRHPLTPIVGAVVGAAHGIIIDMRKLCLDRIGVPFATFVQN
jgi:hypothetical protein